MASSALAATEVSSRYKNNDNNNNYQYHDDDEDDDGNGNGGGDTTMTTAPLPTAAERCFSSPSPPLDCRRLVHYAATAEAECQWRIQERRHHQRQQQQQRPSLSSTPSPRPTSFGHGDPPRLVCHQVVSTTTTPTTSSSSSDARSPNPRPTSGRTSSGSSGSHRDTTAEDGTRTLLFVVIAYTRHTVTAQLLEGRTHVPEPSLSVPSSPPSPPPPPMLASKVLELCALTNHDDDDDDDDDDTSDDSDDDDDDSRDADRDHRTATTEDESITCLSVVELEDDPPSHAGNPLPHQQQRRLSVVFGTTLSRLYATELLLLLLHHPTTTTTTTARPSWTLERVSLLRNERTLFRVFPDAQDDDDNNNDDDNDTDDMNHEETHATRTPRSLVSPWNHRRRHRRDSHRHNRPTLHTRLGRRGGVVRITSWSLRNRPSAVPRTTIPTVAAVWVVYGDGTCLRVPHAALGPSVWHAASTAGRSVDAYVGQAVTACRVVVGGMGRCRQGRGATAAGDDPASTLVVPLPRAYPTLTELTAADWDPHRYGGSRHGTLPKTIASSSSLSPPPERFQALVFAQSPSHMGPALAVYASRTPREAHHHKNNKEFSRNDHHDHGDDHDDGTIDPFRPTIQSQSSVKRLVGSAWTALRWGLGGSSRAHEEDQDTHTTRRQRSVLKEMTAPDHDQDGRDENESPMDQDSVHDEGAKGGGSNNTGEDDGEDEDSSSNDSDTPLTPFPSLALPPVQLYPLTEFHDAPRKIESCSIDPEGQLAAAADGIGRVLLIDLSNRMIIRMWKGFRDAECHWMQTPPTPDGDGGTVPVLSPSPHTPAVTPKRPWLYLVIHSRQRRVVEVFRLRHGARVLSLQVGRDARIVPYTSWTTTSTATPEQPLARCYLLHSAVPGTGLNQMEALSVTPGTSAHTSAPHSGTASSLTSHSPSSHRSTHRSTGVPPSPTPSRKAAVQLQHLQQLLTAGNHMAYTKDDVRKALHEIRSLVDLSKALDLLAVASVLEEQFGVKGSSFFKEVALVYSRNVLTAAVQRSKGRGTANNESSKGRTNNPHVQLFAHKIEYHTQIVKAYDVLHKFEHTKQEDAEASNKTTSSWAAEAMAWASTYEQVTGSSLDADVSKRADTPLRFADFAASCTFPDSPDKEKGCKIYFSESSRTRRDVLEHVFKPLLADVFSFNAVYAIFDNLGTRSDSKYVEQCFGEWFMTLSIRDAYTKGLNSDTPPMVRLLQDLVARQLTAGKPNDDDPALGVLCKFCEESSDLVRAFMLGSLCLEAVTRTSMQKEKWSYGKIQSARIINHWAGTLRKLRICLLVSLRMNGTRLAAPMTVDNVNQPDLFSAYDWLARDELSISHCHIEILALEKACSLSSHAFDPSLPDGDGPARFKVLQNSCLTSATSKAELQADSMKDSNEDPIGTLLLFLGSYNKPNMLAAHRALILAGEWGAKPETTELLYDSMIALRSLHREPGCSKLAASVCLEVWQTQLCPIYKAHLFGFDDVQQIDESRIAPLLQSKEWLTAVGRTGLQCLAILKDYNSDEMETDVFEAAEDGSQKNLSWPPVQPDFMLERLVDRLTKKVDESALDAHSVVMCALLVSGDIRTLVQCVPSIYNLFVHQSLFRAIPYSSDVGELQQTYLNDAVFRFAAEYSGAVMECFDLMEIETLAHLWSFDLQSVHTLFLLAMYELGKDRVVDELVTKASSQIKVQRFVEDGVDIACHRLNDLLMGRRLHSAGMRDVLGLLDAGLCEWIRHRAENSGSLVDHPDYDLPIGSTHLFVMRLLSLSAGADVESTLRAKIHSLVVMSGILVKAMSSQTND